MRKTLSALFLALAALSVICATTACSSKEDPQEDPKVEVSEVRLSQTSATLEVGGTVNLTATVSPSNATDKTVSWSTSDAGVATVSNGLVTAVGEGSATITAKAGGKSATCSVQVSRKTVAVTGVTLNKTELSLVEGNTFQLEATVSPNDATDKTVAWSTSNAGVATVSNGLVTAVGVGSATITAKAGGKSATCSVQVSRKTVAVTGVTLNKTELSLVEGNTFQLEATVSPNDATDKTVAWSTSNAGVATVSNGLVTAVGVGSATITATAGGKSATCSVQVSPKTVAVTGITLNESEVNLYLGNSFQLQATVSPADATDKTVTWRSEDPNLATVDQNGLVTAVNPGTCGVWAEHGNIAAKCVIHCNEKPKVTSIVFNTSRYTVNIGKTVKVEYTYYPTDAVNTNFTWTVSNTEIATVDNTGTVTGKALGTVTVTVAADNGVAGHVTVAVSVPGGNEDYDYEDLN